MALYLQLPLSCSVLGEQTCFLRSAPELAESHRLIVTMPLTSPFSIKICLLKINISNLGKNLNTDLGDEEKRRRAQTGFLLPPASLNSDISPYRSEMSPTPLGLKRNPQPRAPHFQDSTPGPLSFLEALHPNQNLCCYLSPPTASWCYFKIFYLFFTSNPPCLSNYFN